MQGALIYWFNIVTALTESYLSNAIGNHEPAKTLAILKSIKIPPKCKIALLWWKQFVELATEQLREKTGLGFLVSRALLAKGVRLRSCMSPMPSVEGLRKLFSKRDGLNFHISVHFSLRFSVLSGLSQRLPRPGSLRKSHRHFTALGSGCVL